MRIGVIDVGSNSTKCFVYEIVNKEIEVIYFQTYYNRIGELVTTTHNIQQSKIIELIEILLQCKNALNKMKVDNIVCFGTWALRSATNKEIVIENIREETGFTLTLLDEDKENLYTFYSLNLIKNLHGKRAALNVGGGSVELAIGEVNLEDRYTFNLGGVVLKEKFFSDTTIPNFAKVKRATDYVWKILKEHNIESKLTSHSTIVGIGGTFSSLFDIIRGTNIKAEEMEKRLIKLPEESFSTLFTKVKDMKEEMIQRCFNLHKKRADIFLPCLVVIKSVLDILKLPAIYISTLSVREGYIYYNYIQSPTQN